MNPAPLPAPTTGLPGLDEVLQGVRAGDNIVWQVQALDEYQALVGRYAAAARQQKRRLIYFRFAGHAPLLDAAAGAEVHHPCPADGFDAFVDQVHSVIEAAGVQTWYVFDVLSDLADAWSSDRMMANFFRLTCPRLFDLDTVTYFGVTRQRHAPAAMRVIADTTQFLLDVFRGRGRLHVRPLKVQHRSAAAMHLMHAWDDGDRFRPVADSATVSEVLAGSGWPGLQQRELVGHWQRFFDAARTAVEQRHAGRADVGIEAFWFERLARLLFPHDEALQPLLRRVLRLEDLFAVRERMIGDGSIGGKALGMLLARAVLRADAPALAARLEAHDSFYVGTEVYDTFVVHNGLWWIRRRQREPEGFLQQLDEARERVLTGAFDEATMQQFEGMLEYFGEWPYVVRSSSRLEDLHGSAFAGQYDSVFCANRGPREQRLAELLAAVRAVYASSLAEKALRYRQRRGLLQAHEQMALLIMRVSGTAGPRHMHPHAAGVGLSFNPWRWHPRLDPRDGVVRLVAGLGTRAVDRHDDDATAVVALGEPMLRPHADFGAVARRSQRRLDTLDLQAGRVVGVPFAELVSDPSRHPWDLLSTRERPGGPAFLTFDGLLQRSGVVADLRQALATLQAAYAHPVEIEFALNFGDDGSHRLHLLQCRPVQMRADDGAATVAPPDDAPRLLAARGAVLGPGRVLTLDRCVLVRPSKYGQGSLAERGAVARVVARVLRASAGRRVLLLGPGRWGSSDAFLGLPVSFADIAPAAALCEIVAMHEGLVPEVSLGTHFLNELIEADLLYFALFPGRDGNRFDETAFDTWPNRLVELQPDAARWADWVHVADIGPGGWTLHADALAQSIVVSAAAPAQPDPPDPPDRAT